MRSAEDMRSLDSAPDQDTIYPNLLLTSYEYVHISRIFHLCIERCFQDQNNSAQTATFAESKDFGLPSTISLPPSSLAVIFLVPSVPA